jgi:hypothetical protein
LQERCLLRLTVKGFLKKTSLIIYNYFIIKVYFNILKNNILTLYFYYINLKQPMNAKLIKQTNEYVTLNINNTIVTTIIHPGGELDFVFGSEDSCQYLNGEDHEQLLETCCAWVHANVNGDDCEW